VKLFPVLEPDWVSEPPSWEQPILAPLLRRPYFLGPLRQYGIKLLREAIGQYGKPDEILTDRGTQFYPGRGGISEFTDFCSENDIQHILTSMRRPPAIGKIEASDKAYTIESQPIKVTENS
jgi:hypothetical protein